MSDKATDATDVCASDWLVGGGEMGKVVRSMDWTNTPLGPIESWPQSLRTTVDLCLASNFPISLAWGPKHIQIYNDGYWPICGGKHPGSMGEDFSECWSSAWPAIGEVFERALAGTASFLENQRMFLDRNGYLEETFFTFSFSPIRDETGQVAGLFHPVTETTAKMIGERRTLALRDLAALAPNADTTEDALQLAAQTLREFDLDVPFACFYLIDWDAKEARLVTATECLPESIAIPLLDLAAPAVAWPLEDVGNTNRRAQIDDLETRFGPFSCGPYPETPNSALALPITPAGCERPLAILIAGISSRLPLNEPYSAFYDLLAATITSSINAARAYEEERKRAEALAEINRAKTEFFSNVSHEFRTPLTLMLGPLEDELADATLTPETRERIETAHRNALRLLKLVNTLLDFSRAEAGRIQVSYEATDLAAYTRELASVFRPAMEKGGLSLIIECEPLPEPVYVDKEMWDKIVLNLLSNALKHTFEGEITVKLKWLGAAVELVVRDSGVGIPEPDLPRLFERFHRVKGARSRTYEGTGIGLALVQQLVQEHGGTIQVESQVGHGTTFIVTISTGTPPAGVSPAPAHRSSSSTAATAAAYVEEAMGWIADDRTYSQLSPAYDFDQKSQCDVVPDVTCTARARILWADDNADMRGYVSRLLAGHYEVTAVPDGAIALAAALEMPPDLVLSDVMMPNLDGFGLLRELRAHESTRTIPVILLSARAGEESAVEGLEAGADDYLVKPFSARELLARVRTHLDMAKLRRELQVELERRVRERTAELNDKNEELKATTQQLWQASKLATMGELAASVAHELNNPLATISLRTESLLGHIAEESRDSIAIILGEIERMAELVRNLLDFSRRSQPEITTLDISQELLNSIEFIGHYIRKRNVQIVMSLADSLPKIQADRQQLRQLFLNVLTNASDAMSAGGSLTVSAALGKLREEPAIEIKFEDTGEGIPADSLDRIWDPFYTTKPEGKGTGLGMGICRRIVEEHGGRIVIESELDHGTTVHVLLPTSRNGATLPLMSL